MTRVASQGYTRGFRIIPTEVMSTESNFAPVVFALSRRIPVTSYLPHAGTSWYGCSAIVFTALTTENALSTCIPGNRTSEDSSMQRNAWEFSINRTE